MAQAAPQTSPAQTSTDTDQHRHQRPAQSVSASDAQNASVTGAESTLKLTARPARDTSDSDSVAHPRGHEHPGPSVRLLEPTPERSSTPTRTPKPQKTSKNPQNRHSEPSQTADTPENQKSLQTHALDALEPALVGQSAPKLAQTGRKRDGRLPFRPGRGPNSSSSARVGHRQAPAAVFSFPRRSGLSTFPRRKRMLASSTFIVVIPHEPAEEDHLDHAEEMAGHVESHLRWRFPNARAVLVRSDTPVASTADVMLGRTDFGEIAPSCGDLGQCEVEWASVDAIADWGSGPLSEEAAEITREWGDETP